MKSVVTATAIAAVLAVGALAVPAVFAAPTASTIPEKVGNFQLTDHTRLAHELFYFDYVPAIVIMSQTNGSKLSREAAAELAKVQAAYKDKGVLFYMINSNTGDSREEAAAEAKSQKFAMPVLMDELQLVGEKLGYEREGEVFIITPKDGFKVAYHGPLDDRFARSTPNVKAAAKDAYNRKSVV